jgi:hypothetical protein
LTDSLGFQVFKAGDSKVIFVEKARLDAGKPAIVVQVPGRPAFRFKRVILVDGPAIVEQRGGGDSGEPPTAYLYTHGEVEGRHKG